MAPLRPPGMPPRWPGCSNSIIHRSPEYGVVVATPCATGLCAGASVVSLAMADAAAARLALDGGPVHAHGQPRPYAGAEFLRARAAVSRAWPGCTRGGAAAAAPGCPERRQQGGLPAGRGRPGRQSPAGAGWQGGGALVDAGGPGGPSAGGAQAGRPVSGGRLRPGGRRRSGRALSAACRGVGPVRSHPPRDSHEKAGVSRLFRCCCPVLNTVYTSHPLIPESQMEQGVKRTQRDYSLAFKLAVVDQVEKGELTYKQAQERYGIQGRSTVL